MCFGVGVSTSDVIGQLYCSVNKNRICYWFVIATLAVSCGISPSPAVHMRGCARVMFQRYEAELHTSVCAKKYISVKVLRQSQCSGVWCVGRQ